jgi:anti-anti-sigma factor
MDAQKPVGSLDARTNTLVLSGEWDFASKDELRDLSDQINPKLTATLDLIDVTFIDSSVINEIVRTHNRLKAGDVRFRVLIGDDRVARLLSICGIDRVVDVERGTH